MFLLDLLLLFIVVCLFPKNVQAVLPPDFIFNVTTQIIQSFSIALIFLSVTFGSAYRFIKLKYTQFQFKKTYIPIILALIIVISLLVARVYGTYLQNLEYQKWLTESQTKNTPKTGDIKLLTTLGELDNLSVGESKTSSSSLPVPSEDINAQFIRDYYNSISEKNYEKAYEVSKKSVSFETFKSWYLNTDEIKVDKITKIDSKKSSLELSLKENGVTTRYGVLITLTLVNGKPFKIEDSQVKVLENNTVKESQDYPFFDSNSNQNIVVTNEEFNQIIKNNITNIIILDARENIEYENGFLPGSTHIRFADIKAGRWLEIPSDRVVYVLCWSGIRGKEVAEFLRTKKIVSRYLENGANGWVAFGGQWSGSIKFTDKYNEYRFQRVMTTGEVKDEVAKGTILIDCREPEKYNKDHLAGSINIATMYIPSFQYEAVLNQVLPGSKIIAICDGYVNCFDAKITGVELEKRGHTFIGRYNKPWEYEK